MRLSLSLFFCVALTAACTADDGDSGSAGDGGTSDGGTTDSGASDGGGDGGGDAGMADLLVGDWLSEGDDISSLLAYYGYTSVTSSFLSDGSYVVDATGSTGAVDSYAGTFVADDSAALAAITLTQTSPSAITAEGIFTVEDDVLTYEVVQTSPDIGCTPPTVQSGFATTDCSGQTGDYNVQVFRRQ